MTIVEGVGIASVVTTIAYGFRWLVGLEGRLNAHEAVEAARLKWADERHGELMRANAELRSDIAALRAQLHKEQKVK